MCNLASLVFPTFIVKLVERDGNYQYKTWIGSPTQLGKLQYDLWGVTPTELVGLKEKIAALVLGNRSRWHLCLQLRPVRCSDYRNSCALYVLCIISGYLLYIFILLSFISLSLLPPLFYSFLLLHFRTYIRYLEYRPLSVVFTVPTNLCVPRRKSRGNIFYK